MRATVTEVSSCSQRSNFSDFTSVLQRAAANSRKECACTIAMQHSASPLAAVRSTWNGISGHCSYVYLVSVKDVGKTRGTDGFVRLEFMHKMV